MNTSHLTGLRTRSLLALLASTAVLSTGCSNTMTPSAGSVASSARPGTIGGRLHGGNQPVVGATVNLYFAGKSGVGAGVSGDSTRYTLNVLAAHTTTANDGFGSFSFTLNTTSANGNTDNTFSCPTSPSSAPPYVYAVARGGNTVGSGTSDSNSDAVFIAPIGRCDRINAGTFVNMSEVVTVATMAAIHQYIDPTASPMEASISSDAVFASDNGLANAFDSVANMVDLHTGLAASTTPHVGTGSTSGVTVNVTPETAKINHLANVISSCINNATGGSANCNTLYSAAAQIANGGSTSVPGATQHQATDVLGALFNIFTNPTNGSTANLQTIYGLSGAGAPYGTGLTTAPTDWTIGVKYVANGTCTGTSANFVGTPSAVAVDVNGNIWVTNNQSGAGSVAEIAPNGVPTSCFATVAGAIPVTASGLTIDTAGNAWAGSATTNDIFRFAPAGSTTSAGTLDITTPTPVVAVAADGFGNVYYTTNDGRLVELAGASNATTNSVTATEISTATTGAGLDLAIAPASVDGTGHYNSYRLYATTGAAAVTSTTSTVAAAGTSPTGFSTVTASAPNAGIRGAVGLAVAGTSNLGSAFFAYPDSNEIGFTSPDGSGGYSGGYFPRSAGLNTPIAVALDGSGNIWAANNAGNSVSELNFGVGGVSPSTGYVKSSDFLGASTAIAIDLSGSVWLGAGANTVTQIVGAGVPVYQPFASALGANRFQQIP